MIIANSNTQLNEANEKALTPVCSVHVQKIFALLHAKAVMEAEKAGVKIENTAADGNDPKNAVFHSAGEHMIVARNAKEGEKIKKETAFNAIQTYIGIFCGEDVAKSLKEDECFALTNDDAGTEVSEAVVGDHIFSKYLAESAGIKYIGEADDADDDIDLDDGDDYLDTDYGHDDDDGDEAGTGEDDEDDSEDDDDDTSTDDDDNDDDNEDGEGDKDAENEEDPSKIEEADAFYVLYGLKIKGLKETTVGDALKQWGSNFLKGFGVKLIDGWGGSGGELHTVGGLVKGLRGLFGAIDDPEELAERVQDQLRKKFPSIESIGCQFRDKKTLVKELDNKEYSDGGWPNGKNKQKINSADYSMVINVKGDDLKQPFVNRKIIANTVTMQIKGLFKKFKNMIKADDVIYLKGGKVDGEDNSMTVRRALNKMPTSVDGLYDKLFGNGSSGKDDSTVITVAIVNDKFSQLLANVFKDESNDEFKNQLQNAWKKFYGKYTKDGHPACTKKIFYDEFGKEYMKILKELQKAGGVSVSEGVDASIYTAYDIIQDLFESHVDGDGLTDIYEQPPEYLVLAEDDKDTVKPLSDDQKSKLKGPIIDKIFNIAEETIKAGKAKINFAPKMAKFARIDIDACSNIENTEAAQYNLIQPILEKVESGKHPYFIITYFKIPKEIDKKEVNEADNLLDEADNIVVKYLKKNRMSKDAALKDDVIEKIRGMYKQPRSVDKIKAEIEKYFEKNGDKTPAEPGKVWKGTPGHEGFNEENIKKAFELAVDGEIYDFQRYTREAASNEFKYYGTNIPADVDVFFALADKLNGIDTPPPTQKEVYFAVSEDLENPDPTKIQKFLNDENPVKAEDITDELLGKLQEEATSYIGTLNESTVFEDEIKPESNPDGKKQGGLSFEAWTPDPKNLPKESNGKGPDGKDAIVVCAKFKKDGDGKTTDLPIYFAISENLENPDFTKLQKYLNEEKPVKAEDIDKSLPALQEEAELHVNNLNESLMQEDNDQEEDIGDEGDDDEESTGSSVKYQFEAWTPDPKNFPKESNGKGPDGKDAIVVCAKFKKDEGGGEDGGGGGGDESKGGDDVYIIPMPGVTMEKTNSDDDFRGAGEER